MRYHLLINNAGFGIFGAFYNAELPKIETMMRLNCNALVTLSHAFLQQAEKGDALINVSSALAFMPMPSGGAYAATKAFNLMLGEALWEELRGSGVDVLVVCPGATRTPGWEQSHAHIQVSLSAPVMMSAPVVSEALQALGRRPLLIAGRANRLSGLLLNRLMPRRSAVALLARSMRRMYPR